jgi:hypothetical protein
MQTPANNAEDPLMATQVDAWIQTVVGKHEALYRQLLEPENTTDRELAFLGISRLLHEAIEEVRVLGANLRENSIALRAHTTELLEHSQRLLEGPRPYHER